jgi:hypothetical protein
MAEMIKRRDGSYSQRGLWDNIRANKGSGKKPTKEMLAQERKIKSEQSAYGGYIEVNPFLQEYNLGGFFGKGMTAGTGANAMGMAGGMLSGLIPTTKSDGTTSIGGSTAQGALKGFSAGAALGPIGMIGGAAIGGLTSLLQAKQQQEAEQEALLAKQNETSRNTLANMQYGVANASNLPMAMGGMVNPIMDSQVGDFSNFATGGTHEQNPYGGIPQGYNSQGKLRTVEEGEAGFKFNEGKYIFSNRLTFE